jgi:hypothetical protein
VRGFSRSLRPFLQVGVGLFIVVVLGEIGQSLGRWIGVPPFVVFVAVVVAAVFVARSTCSFVASRNFLK